MALYFPFVSYYNTAEGGRRDKRSARRHGVAAQVKAQDTAQG